jgi:hypothetical protein
MSTNVTFSNMLNQYLPEPLLFEELKKRDWMLSNCEQDDSWLGGQLVIPFLGAVGSTITFGSLAAANDIAEEISVRGTISSYKELWSSMIFNETDLMQHGKVNAQNFLRILPDALDRHVSLLKGAVSQSLLTGAFIAKAIADGTSGGLITLAQPDRLQIGQKVQVDDDNSSPVTGYVRAININTGVVTIYDARSGGSVVDLSGYTVAENAVLYQDGQQANGFTALREQLLSASNGGSASLFGQTKTAYPFLQAINIDGSSVSATNILSKIFDAYVTIRRLGRGSPFSVVMSYKNYGACVKAVEVQKGAFNVKPGSQKASEYGFDEIEIGGFAGMLKLIAVQEMDDDIIYFLDMKTIKFYTNGGIRRRKSPEGIEFYTIRNTSGYQYIVDHCLFGDLVVLEPMKDGIMHSIPNYTV